MEVSKIFLLIFITLLKTAKSQHFTKCDTTTTFTAAGQVSYVSWPESGNYNSFCTYIFKAPVDHYIRASVSYYLDGVTPSCEYGEYVAISIDNMPNWEGYSRFCGYRAYNDSIVFESIGNEFKLGVSSGDFTKYVGVSIEVLPRLQGKCDCR